MHVLLVADDLPVARGIALMLRASGAAVDQAENNEEVLARAQSCRHDMIVLSLGAHETSADNLIRRLQGARIDTPILIVPGPSHFSTGRAEPPERTEASVLSGPGRVAMLDQAALMISVHNAVQRCNGIGQTTAEVGDLRVDLATQKVTVKRRVVHLTATEFAILELLVMRRGSVVGKKMIENHIYGGRKHSAAKLIDVYVCKLRRKLADAGAADVITTAWGRGYAIHESESEPADDTIVVATHSPAREPADVAVCSAAAV